MIASLSFDVVADTMRLVAVFGLLYRVNKPDKVIYLAILLAFTPLAVVIHVTSNVAPDPFVPFLIRKTMLSVIATGTGIHFWRSSGSYTIRGRTYAQSTQLAMFAGLLFANAGFTCVSIAVALWNLAS